MKKYTFIILFIIFTFLHIQICAQSTKYNWFNFGASQANSENGKSYMNFGTSINFQSDKYIHSYGFNFTSPLLSSNHWTSSINYGIGYPLIVNRILINTINIGPSITLGETKLDYYEDRQFYWGIGVSINSQLYISPLFFLIPEFSIGIEPYFHYNFYESRKTQLKYIYGIRIGINFKDYK